MNFKWLHRYNALLRCEQKLFTALQTGVIDATEWVGPYNDLTFGFHQAAKYYYYPGWHEPGPMLELLINMDAWNSLPKHLQVIIETATKAVNQDTLDEYLARNNQALTELIEVHGVELRKLPDDVIVINDFSLKFHKPIYNQKENDYIYNVQIDHLLITKAGVFIIETKNWSKRSVNSTYLWSPIKQIKRASYALFIVLNNWMESHYQDSIGHHWGTIQIPIKNMLVMVKNKPKEQFKFVAVKNINELNSYVNYFDPIFS